MFSNASEIHVNYLLHPTMPNMPQYFYHYEKERKFFGRWNSSNNDVDFELDNPLNNPGVNKRHGHHYGSRHRHSAHNAHNSHNENNLNHANSRMQIKNNFSAINTITKEHTITKGQSAGVFFTSYPDVSKSTTLLPNSEFNMNITDTNITEIIDIVIDITEKINHMNITVNEKINKNASVSLV
jgi:hypothetical protein